ncbi:hypothetical protein H7X69_03105 [Candidatus Saccharibacteria bacterium]|nr:hypothetical protein [Candidatus Saccharibacteria bacterium]
MMAFMLILAALGCIILGILVLSRDKRSFMNVLAASINICVAIWSLAILLFLNTSSMTVALVSAKGYYMASALFVALLIIFAMVFPNGRRPVQRYTWAVVAGAAGMLLLLLIPSFVTTDIILKPEGHNYIVVDRLSYAIFCAYFILFFSIGFAVMLRKFAVLKQHTRAQAGSYLFGIVAMSAPGFITNLYLPFFGMYDYIWVGPATASLFVASVTYGIVRHGMFDIRQASVRTLAYIFSFGTLAGIYILLASWLSRFLLNTTYSADQQGINIALALVLVFLFQPIKHFFDRLTRTIFYRDSYDKDSFFARLNGQLTHTSDLRALLERVSLEIGTTLNSEFTFFFVYSSSQSHEGYVSSGTTRHPRMPVADIRTLDAYVDRHGAAPIISDSQQRIELSLRRLLMSHRVAIVLPLVQDSMVIGYLFLGDHRSGGYKTRDINVLKTIADELIIAINNALAVQEIKELNATLQQRIDSATKELRASNAQLQRLDKAKDEFVGMASHQLRTPLTSVKGYISMVIEGDVGKITDAQKHLLNEAFTSSERMVHLINDFLNVSRLQTGKFLIDKRPIQLAKVVEQELDSLATTAASRNLTFLYKSPKDFPLLDLDEGKMRQVIMNFADNALYYSPEHTNIHVKLTSENGEVVFTVKDAGIGVPQSEQSQLFSKFYRASNARKQRPDGTGVGLYLAKKVIDAHGGKVVFSSAEGQGSTFGFRLPLK